MAIVNIEKVSIDNGDKQFEADLSLTLTNISGNTEKEAVSLGSRVQWDDGYTQFVVLKHEYSETANVADTDKTFLHYRYIHDGRSDSTWEAFAQVENDDFKLLSLRTLLGGGMRFIVHHTKNKSLVRLGAGLFASREEYEDSASTVEELVRANLYFTLQYKLDKNITFLTTTYYQPDVENTTDYRALEQMALEFNLTEKLIYFMNLDVSYDNEPVSGVEKNDASFINGLKYRF